MTTLAKDTPRAFETAVPPIFNDIPALADILYEGSALGISSGYARPFVVADEFIGFCEKQVDNSAGSNGDEDVHVRSQGIAQLTVVGASAVTHINDAVYATDDNVFTLTSSGATQIGKVHRWVTSTTCMVYFQAVSLRSQAALD